MMAGYWPWSYLAFLLTSTLSRSIIGWYPVILTSRLFSNACLFQGDSGNSQPQPTGAIATVPYYTQATPVNIVSRPQMVIPVSGQPPFHAGTRPTFVHSAQVPPQVHWQPATMQYQEVRAAAFQPVMHYGAVPQASAGGPGQAPYGVPTGGGMHYVRGVKDIQGQGVRDWNSKHRSFYVQNRHNYSNAFRCFLWC